MGCSLLSGVRVSGVEQVDVAVELPQRVGCVAGRGAHLEVAVHLLRSVAVGDVPPVGSDVELVDRRARRGRARAGARSRRSASRCPGRGPRPWTPPLSQVVVGCSCASVTAGRCSSLGLQPVEVRERRRRASARACPCSMPVPLAGVTAPTTSAVTADECDKRQRRGDERTTAGAVVGQVGEVATQEQHVREPGRDTAAQTRLTSDPDQQRAGRRRFGEQPAPGRGMRCWAARVARRPAPAASAPGSSPARARPGPAGPSATGRAPPSRAARPRRTPASARARRARRATRSGPRPPRPEVCPSRPIRAWFPTAIRPADDARSHQTDDQHQDHGQAGQCLGREDPTRRANRDQQVTPGPEPVLDGEHVAGDQRRQQRQPPAAREGEDHERAGPSGRRASSGRTPCRSAASSAD